MSAELIATAFVMGLAGAAHCTAMCGAACAALTSAPRAGVGAPGPSGGAPVTWLRVAAAPAGATAVPGVASARAAAGSLWPFLVARVASYAAAGALVAASVAALAGLGQQVAMLRPLWTLLHVAIVVLGLWLLVTGRQPAWLGALRLGGRAGGSAVAGSGWRADPRWRSAAAGAAWVAMPCGLLQSALVVAALADGPVAGAAVMAAFAVASSVGLVAAPGAQALLRRLGGAGGDRLVTRLAGAMLVGASAWALWMLATMGPNAAVCVV